MGFVDDDPTIRGASVHGYPVLGGTAELERALAASRADAVVVSTRKLDPAHLAAAAAVCGGRGVRMLHVDLQWQALASVAAELPA